MGEHLHFFGRPGIIIIFEKTFVLPIFSLADALIRRSFSEVFQGESQTPVERKGDLQPLVPSFDDNLHFYIMDYRCLYLCNIHVVNHRKSECIRELGLFSYGAYCSYHL